MTENELSGKTKGTIQFYWLTVLMFLLISFSICRLFGFTGLYGQDSHEFLQYTKELSVYLSGGPDPGSFSWSVVYPFAAALISIVIPVMYSLQVVSLISAAICYFYVGKTLNLLYPEGTQRQRYTFIWLLCSPFFLRAAVVAMPDMFCCALLSAAYYHIIRAEKENNDRSVILAVILGVLVVQTRYVTALLLLPLIPVFITASRKRYNTPLFAIAAAVLALTPFLFFKPEMETSILDHPWITEWSVFNIFRSDFITMNGTLHYSFPNFVYVSSLFVHPGFCIATPFLLITLFNQPRRISKWWFAGLGLYLFFLAGLPSQNIRFLLPAMPLVLLILYPGFESAISIIQNRTIRIFIVLALASIQLIIAYLAIRPFYKFQQEESIIAEEMKQLPPGTVYTFAIDDALRTYEVPQKIINLWTLSDPLLDSGSMLLYNPLRFNERFSNTPPDKIYTQLLRQNKLIYLKTFPNGWQLYRIK